MIVSKYANSSDKYINPTCIFEYHHASMNLDNVNVCIKKMGMNIDQFSYGFSSKFELHHYISICLEYSKIFFINKFIYGFS